jgi:hypothetical protein
MNFFWGYEFYQEISLAERDGQEAGFEENLKCKPRVHFSLRLLFGLDLEWGLVVYNGQKCMVVD